MKTDLKIRLQQTIDHLGDNEPILIAEIQKLLADEQLVTAEQNLSQPFATLMHTEIQKQINYRRIYHNHLKLRPNESDSIEDNSFMTEFSN